MYVCMCGYSYVTYTTICIICVDALTLDTLTLLLCGYSYATYTTILCVDTLTLLTLQHYVWILLRYLHYNIMCGYSYATYTTILCVDTLTLLVVLR